jgi:DNA-binding XRE family transcriptional regulator
VRGGSGPDRSNPDWAKPLAPLPDWLASVDRLLQSVSVRNQGYNRDVHNVQNVPPQQPPGPTPWELRREWLRGWRKRFALTEAKAAESLGYDGPDVIAHLEQPDSTRPRRNRQRQRALPEERWGEPVADKASWLRAWRKRLGISQCKAASILGYRHRCAVSRVEYNEFDPSWEKILIAIHAERALRSE